MIWLMACTASPQLADVGSPSMGSSLEDTASLSTGGSTTDTAETSSETSSTGDGYHGVWLDPPLDPVVFVVENQDRVSRSEGWLLESPTVLWFYRDAGTAG